MPYEWSDKSIPIGDRIRSILELSNEMPFPKIQDTLEMLLKEANRTQTERDEAIAPSNDVWARLRRERDEARAISITEQDLAHDAEQALIDMTSERDELQQTIDSWGVNGQQAMREAVETLEADDE